MFGLDYYFESSEASDILAKLLMKNIPYTDYFSLIGKSISEFIDLTGGLPSELDIHNFAKRIFNNLMKSGFHVYRKDYENGKD